MNDQNPSFTLVRNKVLTFKVLLFGLLIAYSYQNVRVVVYRVAYAAATYCARRLVYVIR